MSIFRDFTRRNEIDAKASLLVSEYFTDLATKKTIKSNEKKLQRKLEKKINEFKFKTIKYSTEMKLGVYGKARLLRAIQNQCQQSDLNPDLTESIMSDLLNEPINKST